MTGGYFDSGYQGGEQTCGVCGRRTDSYGTCQCACLRPCPDCEGNGWVTVYRGNATGPLRMVDFKRESCMNCLGRGKVK